MKTFGGIVRWIVAVVAAFLCIGAFWLAFCYQKAPLDMMQITHEEVAEYRLHKLHEVMPVSFYAEDDENTAYVLVACPTASEELLLASLSIDMGLPLYEQIVAFMEDETQLIGDLTFSCYAFINSDISDGALLDYYEEAIDFVRSSFDEAAVGYVQTNLEMEYICDINEDYKSYANSQSLWFAGFGAIFLLTVILRIVMQVRKRFSDKREASDEEARGLPMEDPADLTNRR